MSTPIRKPPTLQEFKELGKKMEQDRIKMLYDFKIDEAKWKEIESIFEIKIDEAKRKEIESILEIEIDEATWKEIEFILEKARCPIVIKL